MKIRFYLAPQQGTGTFLDPYRSILNDLIDIHAGDWFDEIDNPARHISICCVHASDDAHTAIEKDLKVIPVSLLYKDEAELKQGMGERAMLDTIHTTLLANGIDKNMVVGTTVKDFLSYLIKIFTVAQIADGKGDQITKNLIASDLSAISGEKTVKEAIDIKVKELGIIKLKMSGEEF
jgi:hypothetical protein